MDIVNNSHLSTLLAILRTFSRILHFRPAYAIMPVGKRKLRVHLDKERIPEPCCSTVRGFFFSFILAKHPVGYLLSLSFLSSHLQMRWQITPAKTATTKEIAISIRTPPPCCRVSVRQHGNYIIIQFAFLPFSSKNNI